MIWKPEITQVARIQPFTQILITVGKGRFMAEGHDLLEIIAVALRIEMPRIPLALKRYGVD
jgi:hypothetical protein